MLYLRWDKNFVNCIRLESKMLGVCYIFSQAKSESNWVDDGHNNKKTSSKNTRSGLFL